MNNRSIKRIDKTLLGIVAVLLILGVLLIQSSSLVEGIRMHDDGLFFVKRHVVYIGLGVALMLITQAIDYRVYKKFAIPILLIAVAINLLLYTEIGKVHHGSRRWLEVFGVSVMPSELLKIASPIFIATLLEQFGSKIKNSGPFIFTICLIGIITAIVFFKDMGSAMVVGGLMMFMVVAAGANISWILGVTVVVGFGSFWVLKNFERFEYRWKRIIGFRHPFSEDFDNYHLINTLYAVAMGGITGRGLGQGVQKFAYVPNVFSDSIYAVAGEELGLIGAGAIVILFIVLIYRGLIIATKPKDRYGKLLAVGLISSIGIQAMIHIMVNIGMAPITGITLPFISYGGTSIVTSMIQVGILLNISKEGNR